MSQSASSQEISKETPVHPGNDHTDFSYQYESLEDASQTGVDDLGMWIPQIPFQDFLQYLAPPQPNFNLDATINSLRQDPEGILPSGRWSAFVNDPKQQNRLEKDTFSSMPNIFDKVVDVIIANSDLKTAMVQFVHDPDKAPTSSGSKLNRTRPDGYLALKQRSKNALWSDIVLSCEYKNSDADTWVINNVRKCLWSMQHVMRDDPCRRATYGITIENVNMKVWFCCRSAVIVSEPFNFISETELLVRLFAAFAFADKTSLGFDPTVQHDPNDPTNFIFTVQHNHGHFRRFRTKSIISSSGAEPLRGRGTRVFEAIEIDEIGCDKGKGVVLKDTWIDKDRIREGDILAQLYEEAEGDDKALVKRCFLTTVCHGDVWLGPEAVDDTEKGLMRELMPTAGRFSLRNTESNWTLLSSIELETLSHPTMVISQTCDYAHKTHYRIVFHEKGTTIDSLGTFHGVMRTLASTVEALKLLRRLGWVHRDISIGNIFEYEGGAKLADLEYANKVDSNLAPHKIRTGTLHFMPVEVATRNFLFSDSNNADTEQLNDYVAFASQQERVPWTYNYLHDLESLWWVAVWIFFHNYFASDDLPGLEEMADHLWIAQRLFPPSDNASRLAAFMSTFPALGRRLPGSISYMIPALDFLRVHLIAHYRKVESKVPVAVDLDNSDDTIYTTFKDVFNNSRIYCEDKNLIFIPRVYTEGLKREAEEQIGGPPSKRRVGV